MAEDATDVKDAVIAPPAEPSQEPAAPEPSPEENKEPAKAKDPILDALKEDEPVKESKSETDKPKKANPSKDKVPEEVEKPTELEEPQDEKPIDEAKPDEEKARPKNAQDRIRSLANENRALRQQIEQVNNQVYQPQTVEELVAEGESEAMAEVKALRQEREIERYTQQVVEAQSAIGQESVQVLQEMPIFNPESPVYQPEIAAQAAEVFEANLIRDPNTAQVDQNGYAIPGTGQIIGFHASPYQIYKPIYDAYERSNVEGQIQGQKANSKMLASVDPQGSVTPPKPKKDPVLAILQSDDD